MVERMTFKQLQAAISRERKKAKTAAERRKLEIELKELRAGTSTKILRRFKKGFKVFVKKGAAATGKGIVKARKFAEESGAGRGLDIELGSSVPRRGVRLSKRPKGMAKRRRRRVVRQRQSSDDGFFGGLSDLGI